MRHQTISTFVRALIMVLTIAIGLGGEVSADQGFIHDRSSQAPALIESNKTTFQNGPLTLNRAKQIALENSPTLSSALERIKQAREAIAQAKSNNLPTLSATAGWDYSEKTEISPFGYDETQYSSLLTTTQVLFDGFYRKYATLSAEYGEKRTLAAQEKSKSLLAWSVAQVFLNIQLARENIKIAESDMDFNRNQEIEAIAKEKAGTGPYSDVLNFKSKVNSAKSSLLSARQDLNESIYGLAALLGYKDADLPEGITIAPLDIEASNLNLSPDSLESLDANMDDVLSNRPDLQEASLAIQDADARINMAKADYFPTVSLTGGYGTNASNRIADEDSMGVFLGINVSFDIFTGGARKSRVREAQSEKRELQKDLEDAKVTALSDIRSSAENTTTARQQLVLQQENTTLIKTTRDLVEKEYNAGQASLVRLNEAQNELVKAMGNLAMAKVSVILAIETFDYYTGNNIN